MLFIEILREFVLQDNKIVKMKVARMWKSFKDIEKFILTYLAYTNRSITIDHIISLSGLAPITVLNILEDLKKHRLIREKKETGKGVYYSYDINLQYYILKNAPKDELSDIIKKVISFITDFHIDEENKILDLAELYFQAGLYEEGIRYIKKAADILDHSGKKEKAILFYDVILEHFLKETNTMSQPLPLVEDFLDSVFQRVSRVLFYPIPLNKQLELLEKAYEIAKRFKDPFHLSKIKFLLGGTLMNYGQKRKSSRYINEFWKFTEKTFDETFLKDTFFLTSLSKILMGLFSEAIVYYEKMTGNLEKFGDHEEDLISSLLIAFSHVSCGKISRGMGMIDVIRKKAQSLNFERVISHAHFIETIALIGIRKIPEAETCIAKLSGSAKNALDYNTKGALHFCEAFILCTKGDYEGAYENVKNGYIYRESMDMMLHPYCPWILECLHLLESKSFSNDVSDFNTELKKAINGENIFIKGAAHRYRALQNIERRHPRETILHDLKLSEKFLKQSGAEIELARTWIVTKNYYLSHGKRKLAGSLIEKIWSRCSKITEDIFPNDLLESMPQDRKIELILGKIALINKSLGEVKNQQNLLDMVMNAAMDFINAMQCGFYIHEKENLKLIASRNIDSSSYSLKTINFIRKTIIDAIKNNKEIVIPNGDKTFTERFNRLDIKSFIGIPIKLKGASGGCFTIANHFGETGFSDHTLSFMRMFASQIEVGLSNLTTYEEIKKIKERFEDEAIFYRREIGLDIPIEQIIGESEGIKRVIEQVRQVASTDSLVLILGETGVGKELVAKAIHNLSDRKDGPFIPVNIATFPNDLVASELFGHEKGAFSGADERKKGRFELADGGTIFLDEIGDLTPDVQVKLLRILQEGAFERLGSSSPISSNFRVIAATNKNLHYEVEKGRLRKDLFFRLNVFPIYVPPLRERKPDIKSLAQHFIFMFNKKLGKNIKKISNQELNKLMSYHWPGNVRELKHFIERAIILSNGYGLRFSGIDFEAGNQFSIESRPDILLADIEREHIEKTLKRTLWKISGPLGAASILGLPPSTLRHRMKKLGIERPSITP